MAKKPKKIYSGYVPFNYDKINLIDGHYFPSENHYSTNKTFAFWERALFQRACSIVDFDLPLEWQGSVRDFFYYCLFRFGYIGIWNDKYHGFTFQPGSMYGYDWYYQFTNFKVLNPYGEGTNKDRMQDLKIGEECEILKLTPDYRGIWDVISHYAEKLSGLDASIDMSIVNSRLAYILGAKTKAAAESLKKCMDLISNGTGTVITDFLLHNDMKDKDIPFQLIDLGVSKNYILDKQLADFACILNQFDSEIGIPTLPYTQKKERMITDEATMKTMDGTSRSRVWQQTIDGCLEKINSKYGSIYMIKADFIYLKDPQEGKEEDDVNGKNDLDRT